MEEKSKGFIAGALSFALLAGGYSIVRDIPRFLQAKGATPVSIQEVENAPQTYALLVSGRGPANPENISVRKYEDSIKGLALLYQTMINKGIPKSNIRFMLDNPEWMKLQGFGGLEKEVTGNATKESVNDFLDKLKGTKPQDKVYIVFSEAAPKSPGFTTYSPFETNAFSFYTGPSDEPSSINSVGLASELKSIPASKIVISEDYGNRSFLPEMRNAMIPPESTLVISSSNYDTHANNRFLMNLADIYNRNPNQPISEIFQKLLAKEKNPSEGPQAYYFDKEGRMMPAVMYSGFSQPLFPENK